MTRFLITDSSFLNHLLFLVGSAFQGICSFPFDFQIDWYILIFLMFRICSVVSFSFWYWNTFPWSILPLILSIFVKNEILVLLIFFYHTFVFALMNSRSYCYFLLSSSWDLVCYSFLVSWDGSLDHWFLSRYSFLTHI